MADGSENEKKKFKIWLWHLCLGRASFGYLQKLFPSLFAKSDISDFCCDICELDKSHRASFPLILNKSPLPFMVIHSDIWGPSKVPNLSGSSWFVTFIDDCTRMTWLCLIDLSPLQPCHLILAQTGVINKIYKPISPYTRVA